MLDQKKRHLEDSTLPPPDSRSDLGQMLRTSPELQDIANKTLARRSVSGITIYLILALVVGYFGNPDPESSTGFRLGILVLVSVSIFRLSWALNIGRQKAVTFQGWRRVFGTASVAAALTWGLLCTTYVAAQGFTVPANLFIISTVGLCAGAVNTLAPNLTIQRAYVTSALAPLLAVPGFRTESESWGLALMVSLYLGFLWIQSAMGHSAFWTVLLDKQLLRQRAGQLERARSAAEAALEARSRFLANMSHEIRTPMNGVLGMTSLALETELTGEQRDYLETALSSGKALQNLLNDILDFSKMEAGRLELERVAFDLSDLCQHTLRMFQLSDTRNALAIDVVLDDDLPRVVVGDPNRLRQVLVNLLGNAVKFTSCGSVTLAVALAGHSPGNTRLRFEVRDTGIGIPRGKQREIFGLFTQADASTTRKYGGTGLGLAISSQLVRLMGGEIGVESEEGEGSTFSFVLPLELPSREGAIPALPSESDPAASSELPRSVPSESLRVLVAEDNPVNAKLVQVALEKRGHGIEIAENGVAAVELWRRGGIDLILMDVQMPEMDGFEATKMIRETEERDKGHTPIIALTARAMAEDRARCLEAGMDAYLSKPFDLPRLVALVERLAESALRAGAAD